MTNWITLALMIGKDRNMSFQKFYKCIRKRKQKARESKDFKEE